MSMRNTQILTCIVAAAAAGFFIQVGTAAAATPHGDIQQQMRELLSGSIPGDTVHHPEPHLATVADPDPDAQAFVRELLLGWSVSHVGRAKATKQKLQAAAPESSQKPQAGEDFQSAVRLSLLGESASLRGGS